MNKTVILVCTSIGMTVGAFVPQVWGDHDLMGAGSILWGMIGGFVGIWLGVKLSKQLS